MSLGTECRPADLALYERMFVPKGIRKPAQYVRARELRAEGMSYKRIAREVSASPSSAFHWTKDIELTPEQMHHNLYGPRGPRNSKLVAAHGKWWREYNRDKRRAFQEAGRLGARRRDPLHLTGCMLYWAEGSKNRNVCKLANSDPRMLRTFRRFLSEAMGVPDERMVLGLNLYLGNGLTVTDIENHWMEILELPRTAFRKHVVDHFPTSSSGRRRNKLPYGVCSLEVGSTELVQHIFGAIQEYGGFDEPRWLDCDRAKPVSTGVPVVG